MGSVKVSGFVFEKWIGKEKTNDGEFMKDFVGFGFDGEIVSHLSFVSYLFALICVK
jgi:hypothetical protein